MKDLYPLTTIVYLMPGKNYHFARIQHFLLCNCSYGKKEFDHPSSKSRWLDLISFLSSIVLRCSSAISNSKFKEGCPYECVGA
jgi:hypothetical protein